MKFSTTIFFFAFIALIGLQSCAKQTGIATQAATKEYPGVDRDLWIYFQRFEEAGKERGVNIDLIERGITGEVTAISHAHVVGLCNHNTNEPNHVIIDENFWTRSSTLKKELIIFHELGHCYLTLGHNDNKNNDGTCSSIMRSGTGGCIDMYNSGNRDTYLDELFDLN